MLLGAALVGVTGCSGPGGATPSAGTSTAGSTAGVASGSVAGLEADVLAQARTPYVGDNSAVMALRGDLGPTALGTSTFEIASEKEPYGLTLAYSRWAKDAPTGPALDAAMRRRAALLIGLVGNLDHVTWSGPGGVTGRLDRAEANRMAGGDIAAACADAGSIRALLTRLG